MRKLLMLGVCAFMSFAAFSQVEDEDGPAKPPTANGQTVYGELLGNAGLFSVNYDFRFTKKNKGIGMRVGGGFIGGSGGGILLLPVGILAVMNYYNKGQIDLRVVGIMAITFVIGGWLGSKWALALPEKTVKRIFAVVLFYTAFRMMGWDSLLIKWMKSW